MSDVSDSHNTSGSDEPYTFGGNLIDLDSSESSTESGPMFLEPLSVIYPPGRSEGMGESSTQGVEDLVHQTGRSQRREEDISPVEREDTSGAGNPPILIDEEEEGEEGEDDGEDGDEEGNEEEEQELVVRVEKSKGANNKKPDKKEKRDSSS